MQTTKPQAAKTLVQDVFEVKEKDPDGKKFDKGQSEQAHLSIWRLGFAEPACTPKKLQIIESMVILLAVSRIVCHSDLYEYVMTLDVNTDIYPVEVSSCLLHSMTRCMA